MTPLPVTARPPDRAPWHPVAVRVAPVVAVMVLALGGFAALWLGVRTGGGLAALDPAAVDGIAAARPGWLVAVATVVSDAGSPVALTVLLLAVTSVLAWRGRSWRPVVAAVVGWCLVTGADTAVKHLVARPRPPVELHAVTATGFSFPSGHATISAGLVLLLIWMIGPSGTSAGAVRAGAGPPGRSVWRAAALVFVLMVGASRLVLGVHFPSDVLAGWSLGVLAVAMLVLAVALLDRRPRGSAPAPGRFAAPSTLGGGATPATDRLAGEDT